MYLWHHRQYSTYIFYLKLILFVYFRLTFKFNINILVAIDPKIK